MASQWMDARIAIVAIGVAEQDRVAVAVAVKKVAIVVDEATGGVAVLVQVATDNRNRSVAEIRKIFEKRGGHLGEVNSVSWMFRQVGYFLIDASTIDEDDLLTVALEAGAEDVSPDDEMYEVISSPTEYLQVRQAFEDRGIKRDSDELAMLPNTYVDLDGKEAERCLLLMEDLEDYDDTQNVFANLDIQAAAGAGSESSE